VLSVPLQSVSQSGDQATVFVVDDNNTIDERKVVLGLQTSTDAEIVSGVKQGDRVVISDRSGLKPGLHVKPQVIAVPQDSTH
jgi:multidrug efflux pump subunit AcrA (membrane-fusion protein)